MIKGNNKKFESSQINKERQTQQVASLGRQHRLARENAWATGHSATLPNKGVSPNAYIRLSPQLVNMDTQVLLALIAAQPEVIAMIK